MNATHRPSRAPAGFTLIELLVVIAIIALLIGILLPALGSARSSAVELVCRTRMRELSLANFMYATDNRDRTMPATPIVIGRDSFGFLSVTKNWAYTFERNIRVDEGFLIDYVSEAVDIVGCPLNQRSDPDGIAEDPDDRGRTDIYPGGDLNFDYSFVADAEGAETFSQFDVRYAVNGTGVTPELAAFPGLPLIVEESTVWYNNNSRGGVSDGLWGNYDQWTTRHGKPRSGGAGGGGMTAFVDGSVNRFDPPPTFDNENPNAGNGSGGFSSHNIYLIDRQGEAQTLYNSTTTYGEINEYRR